MVSDVRNMVQPVTGEVDLESKIKRSARLAMRSVDFEV